MKKKNTYVGLVLLLAVLMLGIGYAAMSNITLNIGGGAGASVEDENFKVKFTGTPQTSGDNITATITDDHNATINVSLTAKGDKATATYTILNDSADLSASVAIPSITNSNTEYFTVTTDMADAELLASGADTTVTVTVELIKTPIDADQNSNISISFVASPVQP